MNKILFALNSILIIGCVDSSEIKQSNLHTNYDDNQTKYMTCCDSKIKNYNKYISNLETTNYEVGNISLSIPNNWTIGNDYSAGKILQLIDDEGNLNFTISNDNQNVCLKFSNVNINGVEYSFIDLSDESRASAQWVSVINNSTYVFTCTSKLDLNLDLCQSVVNTVVRSK